MTDAREMLEVLRDSLADRALYTGESADHDNRRMAEAILDAMTEGPGLPWVSVEDRLPEEGEVVMIVTNWHESGWAEGIWQGETWPAWTDTNYMEERATVTHWCPKSAIPLPTDSGWLDAGVWDATHVGTDWACVVTVPGAYTYRVKIKPVGGTE